MFKKPFPALLVLLTAGALFADVQAQEDLSEHWAGEWIAEGTLFRVGMYVYENDMAVDPIESLGFVWTTRNGRIDGNIATIEVEYAGVTGRVQAELVNPTTAVAFAASCLPDFMVVCLLAKGQQAVFVKVADH